jgi:hypothetical protein
MKKLWLMAVLTALVFSSCIFSLHPLYTEDTKLFREDLLGKWSQNEDDEEWLFERMKEDPKGYWLSHTQDGQTNRYEAYLVKLDDHLFLDLRQEMPDSAEEQLGSLAFFLPTHNFFKLEFENPNALKVNFFDGEHLEELFEQRRIRIRHEFVEDSYILTASSQELQKFFAKYADDEEAFSDYEQHLVRK